MTALPEAEAKAIDAAIREVVASLAPDARYVSKYGGHVIAPHGGGTNFIGGIFVYAAHVSLEFSNGATFDDPHGVLEGSGKARRHLKFRDREEVETKEARQFLEQALQ